MGLLPDPEELDAIANRIADHAHAARARASVLGAALAATTWHGAAAGAFTTRADYVLGGLRISAHRLDDAAGALHRHAANVRQVMHTITALGQDIVAVLDNIGNDVGTVLDDVGGLAHDVGHLSRNLGDVGGLAHLVGID